MSEPNIGQPNINNPSTGHPTIATNPLLTQIPPAETAQNPPISENMTTPPNPANSSGGLLFDPSIIGGSSIPVISPVPPTHGVQPSPAGDITSSAQNLTRSDSLAAVIADLNKTLQKTTVTTTGNETIGKHNTFKYTHFKKKSLSVFKNSTKFRFPRRFIVLPDSMCTRSWLRF